MYTLYSIASIVSVSKSTYCFPSISAPPCLSLPPTPFFSYVDCLFISHFSITLMLSSPTFFLVAPPKASLPLSLFLTPTSPPAPACLSPHPHPPTSPCPSKIPDLEGLEEEVATEAASTVTTLLIQPLFICAITPLSKCSPKTLYFSRNLQH